MGNKKISDKIRTLKKEDIVLYITDSHHSDILLGLSKTGDLYHNQRGCKKWTYIRKISYTPKRILAISNLIKEWQKQQNKKSDLGFDQ